MTKSEQRKMMAKAAAAKLSEVELLVQTICDTYGDEKASACHPRSGLNNSLRTLGILRKSIASVK